MGLWDKIKDKGGDAWDYYKDNIAVWDDAYDWYKEKTDRDPNDLQGKVEAQAEKANAWGDISQERVGVLTEESAANRKRLTDIATGKESVSRMELAKALGQNQSMQQSMAASARPQNAAMAARTAAMTAGRQGAALAGQQALAGIQERQAATGALNNALMTERGQDMNAVSNSLNTAAGGYQQALQNALATPTELEKGLGLLKDGAQIYAASDRRLKKNIKDGDSKADKLLRSLKAYEYKYKDEVHGEGDQLGIMAQDLEKMGLKQAVIEDHEGKKIDPGKLAGALAAMLPGINKRLEALEDDVSDDDSDEESDVSALAKALKE